MQRRFEDMERRDDPIHGDRDRGTLGTHPINVSDSHIFSKFLSGNVTCAFWSRMSFDVTSTNTIFVFASTWSRSIGRAQAAH